MNPLFKATRFSLLLHTLLVVSLIALGRQTVPKRPPLALDFSVLTGDEAAGGPAPGSENREVLQPSRPLNTRPAKAVVKKSPAKKSAKQSSSPATSRKVKAPDKAAVPITADADALSAGQTDERGEAVASTAALGGEAPAGGALGRAGAGSSSGVYGAGQLDRPLVALHRNAPAYPAAARRQNIEGWIRVAFLVDEQGRVGRVSVVAAEPRGIFDQSVLRCIAHWRFNPGTVGGVVVKTLVEQTITFKLE